MGMTGTSTQASGVGGGHTALRGLRSGTLASRRGRDGSTVNVIGAAAALGRRGRSPTLIRRLRVPQTAAYRSSWLLVEPRARLCPPPVVRVSDTRFRPVVEPDHQAVARPTVRWCRDVLHCRIRIGATCVPLNRAAPWIERVTHRLRPHGVAGWRVPQIYSQRAIRDRVDRILTAVGATRRNRVTTRT